MDCNHQCQGTEMHQPASIHAYGEIDTQGLKRLMQAKTSMVLLDARSGKWDDGKRLPGAKALAPDAKEKEAAALIPSKESLVVVYCSNSQCPASKYLAEHLHQLGYKNILKYPEGLAGWTEAGESISR